MNIGLDLDGTVYAYPKFFAALVQSMSAQGHRCYCISSHLRDEWEASDVARLREMGIDPDLIDPSLMPASVRGDIGLKGKASDQCDVVFDDDANLRNYTKTPVFMPLH